MELTIVAFLLASCLGVVLGYKTHFQGSNLLTDALLEEMMEKMGNGYQNQRPVGDNLFGYPSQRFEANPLSDYERQLIKEQQQISDIPDDIDDDTVIPLNIRDNRFPSLRDQEYLQHSSLWGHQYVAGGAGEGEQRLKPDGTIKNREEVKTDALLPAYCNPPNPCPVGYTTEDGCMEEFENTASFSRNYQSSQECMCDAEHMFDCPDASRDTGKTMHSGINQLLSDIGPHKSLVAKKFNNMKKMSPNPYLIGDQLPIAAKKGHITV